MLLMLAKGIRGGICHAINRYTKANNKYTKNYKKIWKSITYLVFRSKQFAWMGNISKIICRWFWMGIYAKI